MQFKTAGLSRQKIEYLNGIIFNKNINALTKNKLNKMTAEDYFKLLIDIKGIGPWSIEMSRIFYIGDPDVFSILDLGLKNAHLKIFNNIESYTESFIEHFHHIEAICVCIFGAFLKMRMLLFNITFTTCIQYSYHHVMSSH